MDLESSNQRKDLPTNDDDIENIEKLAEGLTSSHNGGGHHSEREKKRKFSKKTNRFHELNYFLNTIPSDTKKMTRDEKKAVEYQRMFDKMEEKSNKKKKNLKNERKKVKTTNDSDHTVNDIKMRIDLEESSPEEEKLKESNSNEAISNKTASRSPIEPIQLPKIKPPDTQINPSFNLEPYDNLFYYLYYYVNSERKIIEEIKEKEFNGEQVSLFRVPKTKPDEPGQRRIVKVDETVFQKTKFIQDSIRRKFKENMDKMNSTPEKDVLVREFTKKHINKEEITHLLDKEFSYY